MNKNIKKIITQLNKEVAYLEKSIQIYISSDISSENEDSEEITNFLQYQIKENMNQNILSEFFLFSKKYKLNQELYLKKCEELVIEEDEEDKELNNNSISKAATFSAFISCFNFFLSFDYIIKSNLNIIINSIQYSTLFIN